MIGAGQAGLAAGYYLRAAGVDFSILEATEAIGTSWTRRWESLRLFTPARYDGLPGMIFPGDPWHYPTKDEVASYLATYAGAFELPVRTGSPVTALRHGEPDRFELHLAGGQVLGATAVVVATGAFGAPYVPDLAQRLDPPLPQLHTDTYQAPDQLPDGPVLVVGAGNSGAQIALELAQAGHVVHLAARTRPRHVPQSIGGRDLFWWLNATGALHAAATTRIGRRLKASDPVIGTPRAALHRTGVRLRPGVVDAGGSTVTFADGTTLIPASVMWATGYRHDDRWIDIPAALDPRGALITGTGHTPVPGLYTLGRPWQRSRGSALLGFVGADAQRLIADLTR